VKQHGLAGPGDPFPYLHGPVIPREMAVANNLEPRNSRRHGLVYLIKGILLQGINPIKGDNAFGKSRPFHYLGQRSRRTDGLTVNSPVDHSIPAKRRGMERQKDNLIDTRSVKPLDQFFL
jgi:hypothetical protein